jgi:hypothetical protein
MPEDPADRRRDVTRRQRGRGDLIQERLKDVVVVPVDQGDLDRGAPERPSRIQPAESPADDDDVQSP